MKSTSPTAARIKSFGRWAYRYCFLITFLFLVAVYTIEYIEAGVLPANASYTVANSARFISGNSDYLSKTFASGNRQKFTFSTWVKRSKLGAQQEILLAGSTGASASDIRFLTSDALEVNDYQSGYDIQLDTSAVFRDPAVWLHIVVAIDTTQVTTSNRVLIYVNGQQITSFSLATYPSQNLNTMYNSNVSYSIGSTQPIVATYIDAYLADTYFVDGQALSPTSFGSYDANGYWRPIAYTGTYGTNGFHLNFSNGASLGTDSSGNGNNWTVNGLAATDQVLDSPTNSFATINPLGDAFGANGSNLALSRGNLRATNSANGAALGTLSISVGKWYWEEKPTTVGAGIAGLTKSNRNLTLNPGVDLSWWGMYYNPTQNLIANGSNPCGVGSITSSDLAQVAVDATNAASVKLWVGKNNTWYDSSCGTTGNPTAGTNATQTITANVDLYPYFGSGNSSSVWDINFGQGGISGTTFDSASGGNFIYTPPNGFLALSTANLPVPTIAQPNKYFDAKTYTGNGSTQSITGLNFQPDLVWLKDRTTTSNHGLFDSVRGATIYWSSNSSAAETTDAQSLTAFLTNGFSLGTASAFNTNANNYISWLWKKAPTTDGVDIQDFAWQNTAFTVSHNLGVTPAMVIVVVRGIADHRYVWHQSLSSATQSFLELDNTIGDTTNSLVWGNTAPTASVIKFAGASDNVIADTGYSGRGTLYAFAPVAGFSAFGKYTGNGSADGPFVYTGFKPRFIMLKQADGTTSWYNMDTARDTYNPALHATVLQTSGVEATNSTDYSVDFLSNGFKLRTSDSFHNASGGNYIYAAFADVPFYYSAQSAASAVSNAGTSFLMGMNF